MEIGRPTAEFYAALFEFTESVGFDEGHNYEHLRAVERHCRLAIRSLDEELEKYQENAILYAALLHEADDSKFFPSSGATAYPNARKFLEREGLGEAEIELIIKMIDLVSCSKNGNNWPELLPEWMLYPRFADRLEATGAQGVKRALMYGEFKGRPIASEEDRIESEEQINAIIASDRFHKYITDKSSHGKTTMSHLLDKVVHLSQAKTSNEYFRQKLDEGHREVVEIILEYWDEPLSLDLL